jgi:hypothetical protein
MAEGFKKNSIALDPEGRDIAGDSITALPFA